MLRQIARNVVPTVARLTRPAVGGTLLARSGCRTLSTSGEDTIQIHWTLKDGTKLTTTDALGGNLMRAAHRHDIELEGACEGVCACSTCHVIFDEDVYDELPEASEDEEDMLDQAFGTWCVCVSVCVCTCLSVFFYLSPPLPSLRSHPYLAPGLPDHPPQGAGRHACGVASAHAELRGRRAFQQATLRH